LLVNQLEISMSNISGTIKSIQDIMRKDTGVDGDAQRISHLVWMFFLKTFDDREEEIELLEENYQSPLPEDLRWRNRAADIEGITGDDLRVRQPPIIPNILMRQVINKISEIDFNNTEDRHTFGSIYEQLFKDLQSAGNTGEFYTPRAVARFIVDCVDP